MCLVFRAGFFRVAPFPTCPHFWLPSQLLSLAFPLEAPPQLALPPKGAALGRPAGAWYCPVLWPALCTLRPAPSLFLSPPKSPLPSTAPAALSLPQRRPAPATATRRLLCPSFPSSPLYSQLNLFLYAPPLRKLFPTCCKLPGSHFAPKGGNASTSPRELHQRVRSQATAALSSFDQGRNGPPNRCRAL